MLTLTPLSDFPLVERGQDLAALILNALPAAELNLEDGDILLMAQKIVSKAEGRMRWLSSVEPSEEALQPAG